MIRRTTRIRANARAFALAAIAAGFAAAALPAAAQSFPTKPIRILVPFGAGGVADITARVVAQKMSETIGQQVIVENRPSAGAVVATDAVVKAEPDGHTLLLVSNGNAVSATLMKSLPFDTVADLAPIGTLGFFDIFMLANGDSPWKSVQEALAHAKANPGKVNVGTINVGSTQNLSAELFKSMAGIDVQVVPFKSSGQVVTALRANDVQLAFEILAPVAAQVKGGQLKALGVASTKRFAGLPNVPTIESGGVPGYQASSWNGLAAPAKTPRAIIDRINKEANAALAAPDVKQRLEELGVEARGGTPEALRELLVAEIGKWKAVIERAKIERQ
jgi:tripartite-type tricarboxylate transporter receptor subunit TctC